MRHSGLSGVPVCLCAHPPATIFYYALSLSALEGVAVPTAFLAIPTNSLPSNPRVLQHGARLADLSYTSQPSSLRLCVMHQSVDCVWCVGSGVVQGSI